MGQGQRWRKGFTSRTTACLSACWWRSPTLAQQTRGVGKKHWSRPCFSQRRNGPLFRRFSPGTSRANRSGSERFPSLGRKRGVNSTTSSGAARSSLRCLVRNKPAACTCPAFTARGAGPGKWHPAPRARRSCPAPPGLLRPPVHRRLSDRAAAPTTSKWWRVGGGDPMGLSIDILAIYPSRGTWGG